MRQQDLDALDAERRELVRDAVTVLEMPAADDADHGRAGIAPVRRGQRLGHRAVPGQLRLDEAGEFRARQDRIDIERFGIGLAAFLFGAEIAFQRV